MGCGDCGDSAAHASVTPSVANVAVGTVPLPTAPCECGRLPWWWVLAAFLAGALIVKARRGSGGGKHG